MYRDVSRELGSSHGLGRMPAAPCAPAERRIRRPVPPDARDLVPVAPAHTAGGRRRVLLHRAAYDAYRRMKSAAEADGIPSRLLTIVSGYRDVERQQRLWDAALRRYGSRDEARKWVAPPGGSPHHSGRAIDLALGGENSSRNVEALRRTDAWRWLSCNAGRFGFTPYQREPWHWEFNPPSFAQAPGPAPSRPDRARPPSPQRTPGPSPAPAPAPAPPPASLPGFTPSEMKALRLTTTFETGGPLGFDRLTGDFDGMGVSLGLLQWNIGTGSLQPLIREFIARAPEAVAQIFGADAGRFRDVMAQPGRERGPERAARIARQLAFFRSLNESVTRPGRRRPEKRVREPWASRLRAMAGHPVFREIQVRAARRRMDGARREVRDLGLTTERALAFIFDTQTQAGGAWRRVRGRQALLDARLAERQRSLGRPLTERDRLEVMAHLVADTSAERWRENVRTRRLTIVTGRGRVHGHDFDLARDFDLTDRTLEGAS